LIKEQPVRTGHVLVHILKMPRSGREKRSRDGGLYRENGGEITPADRVFARKGYTERTKKKLPLEAECHSLVGGKIKKERVRGMSTMITASSAEVRTEQRNAKKSKHEKDTRNST